VKLSAPDESDIVTSWCGTLTLNKDIIDPRERRCRSREAERRCSKNCDMADRIR
jgi:hypothetical protein